MGSAALAAVLIVGACVPAFAVDSKFQVSEAERAACTPDALRLCSDAYPNEDRLLACMKSKRSQMSDGCRPIFDAGIKRRGL